MPNGSTPAAASPAPSSASFTFMSPIPTGGTGGGDSAHREYEAMSPMAGIHLVSRERIKMLYIELLESGESFLRDQSTAGSFLASLAPHETKALMQLVQLRPEDALRYFHNDPEVAEVINNATAAEVDANGAPKDHSQGRAGAAAAAEGNGEHHRGGNSDGSAGERSGHRPSDVRPPQDPSPPPANAGPRGAAAVGNGEKPGPLQGQARGPGPAQGSQGVSTRGGGASTGTAGAGNGMARVPSAERVPPGSRGGTRPPRRSPDSGGAEKMTEAVRRALTTVEHDVHKYVQNPGELARLCADLPSSSEKNSFLRRVVADIKPRPEGIAGRSPAAVRAEGINPEKVAGSFVEVLRRFSAYKQQPEQFEGLHAQLNGEERGVFDALVRSMWSVKRAELNF